MIDQRPQDGGGGGAAERADKRPVIVAGPPLPAAVAGGHPRGLVEQMRRLGQHIGTFRHCEPTGRTNARPMTGSAKHPEARKARVDCFVASLLAMTLLGFLA